MRVFGSALSLLLVLSFDPLLQQLYDRVEKVIVMRGVSFPDHKMHVSLVPRPRGTWE